MLRLPSAQLHPLRLDGFWLGPALPWLLLVQVRFRTKDGNFSFFGVELALFALLQAQVPSRAKRVADATCGC